LISKRAKVKNIKSVLELKLSKKSQVTVDSRKLIPHGYLNNTDLLQSFNLGTSKLRLNMSFLSINQSINRFIFLSIPFLHYTNSL